MNRALPIHGLASERVARQRLPRLCILPRSLPFSGQLQRTTGTIERFRTTLPQDAMLHHETDVWHNTWSHRGLSPISSGDGTLGFRIGAFPAHPVSRLFLQLRCQVVPRLDRMELLHPLLLSHSLDLILDAARERRDSL